MTGLTVTVDDRAVVAALRQLAGRVQNLAPAMRSIGVDLVKNIDLGFRNERDPWGNKWAPLKPSTLARRRGTSAQILSDTRRLANSFSYHADANSVRIGTAVKYAGTHQFGARKGAYGRMRNGRPIPWGDIPRRAMLPISPAGQADLPASWRDDILYLINLHLQR